MAASLTSSTSSLVLPITKPEDKSSRSMLMEEEVACTEMETSSLRSTEAKIDLKSRLSVAEYTSVINGKKGFSYLKVGEYIERGRE